MRGDEGKKASVKLDEIVIYWERKLPALLVIITHLFVVSSRQRSIMIGEDVMKRKTKNQRRADDDSSSDL